MLGDLLRFNRETTTMQVEDRVYDVSVRFPLNFRYDPEALGNLTLTGNAGLTLSRPENRNPGGSCALRESPWLPTKT